MDPIDASPLAGHIETERAHWAALPKSPALWAGAAAAGLILGMGAGDLYGMAATVASGFLALVSVFVWTNQIPTGRPRGPDETPGRSMPESPAFWIGFGSSVAIASLPASEPILAGIGLGLGTILLGLGLRFWRKLRRVA